MTFNWGTVKVEDIAEVKSGKRLPKGKVLVEEKTPYPYIRLVDIADGRVKRNSLQYLTEDTRKSIERYVVNTSDVCLAIVGHSIGMVFFVDAQWDDVNLTENAARITNINESFNPRFIYYYLTSQEGQNDIISRKVGSAQGKLPLYNIKSLELPKIPRDIQNSIVLSLDSLSYKVELNRQTNQTLEHIAQALFKSWFVDFEPTRAKIAAKQAGQDPERAAMAAISGKTVAELDQLDAAQLAQLKTMAALFPDGLVESELGEVPEGWRLTDLKSITTKIGSGATPRGGKGAYKSEGISQIRSMNVFDGLFVFKDLAKIDNEQANKLKSVVVEESDVLINITGASVTRCCIVPPCVIPARVNQHVCIVRANNTVVCPSYIYLTLTSSSGKATLNSLAQAGATREALTKSHIENFEMLLPNEPLMTVFRRKVEHLQDQQFRLTEEVTTLEAIRDTLLPKLLSGELSPTQAEVA